MKTKTIGVFFIIATLILSSTVVSWKSLDIQAIRSTGNAGLHSLVQSSILLADNDKNNRGQMKKRSRLQEDDCFSDDSCLRDRKQTRDRIQLLERQTTETENRFQSYLRANLTDAEKSFVNTQLNAFRNDVDILSNDLKEVLRTGSNLQTIRDRISSLYATYTGTLSPYVDPSKTEEFRLALQTILTNHVNLRQLSENRRVLSDQDESKIERFIIWVPPSQRLDYLLRVLSRVEKLMQNIENSNMNPVRKERFLALLDDILMLVQARITDITSGWNDTAPPVIFNMSVIWISTNSATLRVMVNESGRGYYVILGSGATAPTAAQVKAGQDALGQIVALRGSGSVTSGMNQFALAGLSANTGYVAYFTAEDISNNLQTVIHQASFITPAIPDTTPPTISAISVSGTTSTGTTLLATVNESGTGYYVILLSGSVAPSAVQVQLGQTGTGQTAPIYGSGTTVVGINQFPVVGLSASGSYSIYFTAKDAIGNLQPIVQTVPVMTLSQ